MAAESLRKYKDALARWMTWWDEPAVKAHCRRDKVVGITPDLLKAYCMYNATKNNAPHIKAMLKGVFAGELVRGGISSEMEVWTKMGKTYCKLQSAKTKKNAPTTVGHEKETQRFWDLTEEFHPTGWLMYRVCYEGCLRRQDLQPDEGNSTVHMVDWNSFKLHTSEGEKMWMSTSWEQQKNKVAKKMELTDVTYLKLKKWREKRHEGNPHELSSDPQLFMGANFEWSTQAFKKIVKEVF